MCCPLASSLSVSSVSSQPADASQAPSAGVGSAAGARSGTKDRDSLRYSMDSNISDSDDIFGRLDVMRVRHARSTIAPKARDTFDRRTVEGLDITDECVERLLDLFDDKLNADHDGQVDITQFLANLGIAADPFSHRMFSLVDTGHSFGVTPNE